MLAFEPPIPTLRMFSIEKAKEFYLSYLGFSWDWDHRFHDNAPLFAQISRGRAVLRLSEHHGDGSPGLHLTIPMQGIDAYHAELNAKNYRYMRPGIEDAPWGARLLTVYDPFNNRITFSEAKTS
jgi:hypothetical protein